MKQAVGCGAEQVIMHQLVRGGVPPDIGRGVSGVEVNVASIMAAERPIRCILQRRMGHERHDRRFSCVGHDATLEGGVVPSIMPPDGACECPRRDLESPGDDVGRRGRGSPVRRWSLQR